MKIYIPVYQRELNKPSCLSLAIYLFSITDYSQDDVKRNK